MTKVRGRKGINQVAYRFTCLIKGDLGSLVELLEKGKNEGREGIREGGGGEESLEKRMEVQAVAWTGQVGRVSFHGFFSGLRELLLKQETKSDISAGGSMKPEYLVAPRERMDISEMEDLEEFGLSYTVLLQYIIWPLLKYKCRK